MQATAEDGEKIEYLRQWMAESFDDPNILATLGEHGIHYFPSSPDGPTLGLDLEYLGIKPDSMNRHISVYRDPDDKKDFMDGSTIRAVDIYSGRRAGIIVGRKESTEFDLPNTRTEGLLTSHENGVFAYCL